MDLAFLYAFLQFGGKSNVVGAEGKSPVKSIGMLSAFNNLCLSAYSLSLSLSFFLFQFSILLMLNV